MAQLYQPLVEKDDPRSSEEESQDDESLLGVRKPSFVSSKWRLVGSTLHLLITLSLLITVFIQNRQTIEHKCPKLLPLELRKSSHLDTGVLCLLTSSSLGGRSNRV